MHSGSQLSGAKYGTTIHGQARLLPNAAAKSDTECAWSLAWYGASALNKTPAIEMRTQAPSVGTYCCQFSRHLAILSKSITNTADAARKPDATLKMAQNPAATPSHHRHDQAG